MSLEEILTNRNRLSDDILQEVEKSAGGYGVSIARADVKDLVFPGNLQEIMNRVLAAERNSQAQLVEARTRAEVQRIKAQAKAANQRVDAEATAEARRLVALSVAEAQQITTEAEVRSIREKEQAASAFARHPALLRLAGSRRSAPWPPRPTPGSTSGSTSTRPGGSGVMTRPNPMRWPEDGPEPSRRGD